MRSVSTLILLILFFLSCQGENKIKKEQINESEFWVDLPDSVKIDSTISGLIEYKVSDSPLQDKTVSRKYTFLYATLSEEEILSFEDLKKVPHDTFVVIEKNLIPIYNMTVSSETKKDVRFQGFLIEQFFYNVDSANVRIIIKERRFEKAIKLRR